MTKDAGFFPPFLVILSPTKRLLLLLFRSTDWGAAMACLSLLSLQACKLAWPMFSQETEATQLQTSFPLLFPDKSGKSFLGHIIARGR